ncbi:MAG TPA: amidohydrolase family protein, partial [Candidatus Obscuribacterales bacterium]
MSAPLYIVDFHAHLMTLSGVERICPLEQKSAFFRYAVPILEPIAQLTAPFHDRFLRDVSMHHRDSLSRSVYAQFGQLFLMEALRLFKTHGLKRLVESMDKLRIDHAVIYSLEPLTRTREIVELVGSYPGRFSVFGSVACAEPDAAAYLEPFMQSGSIRGVKIHPMVGGYSVTGLYDETKEYVALAQDYNLPVAIHTGNIPTSSLK